MGSGTRRYWHGTCTHCTFTGTGAMEVLEA